jgi:peptidase E
MADRHIVGLGGGGDTRDQTLKLYDYVLGLTGKDAPDVMYVPTAIAEDPDGFVMFHDTFSPRAGKLANLRTFPWPQPENLRERILEQDAICVSGGNTANMLAIWRVHGIDAMLREADSFGPQLEGMDCLGFLPGSACPHYDGEELRRPRYRELIDSGFADGIAADDGVGLHYIGTELAEVVTCRAGAAAYRVTRSGEEKLPARLLD